jgi:hypothetical protein
MAGCHTNQAPVVLAEGRRRAEAQQSKQAVGPDGGAGRRSQSGQIPALGASQAEGRENQEH